MPISLKIFLKIVIVTIIISVGYGLYLVGSPAKQRQVRFDERRISDLQNISYAVNLYWQNSNNLPENLQLLLNSDFYYINSLSDPKTQELYEYRILEERKYELCANFETESSFSRERSVPVPISQEKWDYKIGRNCFQREVFLENPQGLKIIN